MGDEEELGKKSLEGCGYQETGYVVAHWGEPCSEVSGALRLVGGTDDHDQQRHSPTCCHTEGLSSSGIVT